MAKRVLVTGGTGFLAGWIIAKLLRKGHVVRTTVRSQRKEQVVSKTLHAENIPTANLSFAIADLTSQKGWAEAMTGVNTVLHVASPLGGNNQDDPRLIEIARQGVKNVVSTAIDAGVDKIVMTSSEAANYPAKSNHDQHLDESFWTDLNNPLLTNYMRLKVVAEKTAWRLISQQDHTQLVTVMPGAILGPALANRKSSTAQIFEAILKGMPSPKVVYPVVDVRALADLHLLALENWAADGKRFIAESEEITMPEMARLIKQHYPNYLVSSITIPNWLVSLLGHFNGAMKVLNTMTGLHYHHDNSRERNLLGWRPRPVQETILASVDQLIKN